MRFACATLPAGVLLALPAALAAQTSPTPTPVPPPKAPSASSDEPVFRGPDGKPLPPELQQQLRERLKNGPPSGVSPANGGDVVVTATRPRGSVVGDILPERVLSQVDIRSYGAGTVAELIQALGAQASSARGGEGGSPVVLLNGRRVSSFAEIARIPTEAIERTEILPAAVALKYGYPAEQKVVNVVTFERYTGRVGTGSIAAPTEGGQSSTAASASYLRLRGDTRLAIDAEAARSSALLENERDIQQVADDPLLGTSRTLLPASRRAALNATIAGPVAGDVAATLNARVEASATRALVGRDASGPLRRDGDVQALHLGTTLGGRAGQWLWTATANLDRTTTETTTDTGIAAAPRNDARATNSQANLDLLLSGSPFALPAGATTLSVRGGASTRDLDATSRLGGSVGTSALARRTGSVQANLDLPITARAQSGAGRLGALTLSANAALEEVSDAGTLRSIGAGLYWAPVPTVSLLASIAGEQAAPSLEQLGAPQIVVPNVRTLDPRFGTTVDVTRIVGGNPALLSDDRHVFTLGGTIKPFAATDLVLNLDYSDTRIDDAIAPFPLVTARLEAAFPERFVRDAAGRLQRIDGTALNFARARQRQLRWGFSLMKRLGPLPPGMQNATIRMAPSMADVSRRLPPGAQVLRIESGSPGARMFDNLTSRLMLSVQHLWRIEDSVVLRQGVAPLDLLGGDAVDPRGGRPRHEIEVQAGAFKRGFGGRITANWTAATSVHDLGGPAGPLRFADLATVNLALFANISERLGRARTPDWLRGTRVSLNVTNLLNDRVEVRDGAGVTPLAFQPAYLNPLGRTVALSLRKTF